MTPTSLVLAVKKALKDTVITASWIIIFTILMRVFLPSLLAYMTNYTLSMGMFLLSYFSFSAYKYYKQSQN
jgi:hypothetical protein